jgi:hypothetical protein
MTDPTVTPAQLREDADRIAGFLSDIKKAGWLSGELNSRDIPWLTRARDALRFQADEREEHER